MAQINLQKPLSSRFVPVQISRVFYIGSYIYVTDHDDHSAKEDKDYNMLTHTQNYNILVFSIMNCSIILESKFQF